MNFQASKSACNEILGITGNKELNMQNSRLIEGMGIGNQDESMWTERSRTNTTYDIKSKGKVEKMIQSDFNKNSNPNN
jgi:hypothetical protein